MRAAAIPNPCGGLGVSPKMHIASGCTTVTPIVVE
jgi:hypothetical protein